jgi:hypothetical protein
MKVRRVICALDGKSGLVANVGRETVGGFGDGDRVDLRVGCKGGVQSISELIGNVFGDVLCGGVDRVEGWGGVEVVVGEGGADVDELGLDGVEVAEESVVVEGCAGDVRGGSEVVAVDGFVVSEDGKGVRGTELVGDLDRKHGGV